MKRSEFIEVTRLLNAAWPHSQLPDPTVALMWDDLQGYDQEAVATAIKVLQREGREFAPNGGQIIAKIVDLTVDAPSWAVARSHIVASFSYSPQRWRNREIVDERAERVAKGGPLVEQFVELVGWRELGQALDVEDRTAEAQLRNKWLQMIAGDKGDMALAGLPTAGLKRLERINGPHQIDAAKTLKELQS